MRQMPEKAPVNWGSASHQALSAVVHSRARRTSCSSWQAAIVLQ